MYRINCHSCGRPYDVVKAADCSCINTTGTFVCPSCGSCFCSAPRSFLERFWLEAPPLVWLRRRRRSHFRAPAPSGDLDPEKPVVLFADDDPTGCRIAAQVISALGFNVVTVGDGEQLLQRARELKPELVITDALMPRRDGRDTARQIKEEMPGTRVVVITSVYKDPRYKHEAYREFGVDEYLTKPVSPETLRAVVTRMLQGGDEEPK